MEDKYAAQPEQEIAPKTPDADDVDALLQDVKSLLGESDGETVEQPPPEDEPVPEGPGGEPLELQYETARGTGFWMMICIVFAFLMLFNRIVPNLHLGFREVWPGALFSLVAWVLVSWCFSFYVDNMARYSVLYGSLAAIIVLMLWLYIVSMILLMGPQLNHTLVVMRLYRLENEKHL